MIKKIPWKNILIVFTAMLVVPVIAFAITTADSPKEAAIDDNSNIKITSDEQTPAGKTPDAASEATSLLTAGALGYLDGVTSATGEPGATGSPSDGNADAVSSATGDPGVTGSKSDDDDYDDDERYESNDDDDEDKEAIKEEDEEDEADDEDIEDEEDEEDDD